ncbi:MAG TPA: hypothetical protein VLM17_07745, partial [Xanthomonadaceae bacterium]|nr:hypothetical protein [Xanthomonadaceae bacterium]
MIRQGLVGMALALSAQAAVAGTVAVDGVSVALPVDVSEAKREREFELKDAFIGRGNETRLYDIPREGPHRVLLSGTVRSLHLKSAPSLPQGDPVKNRDAQLASRRAKDATADLEALTVAGSPALLQLSTIKGDEGDTAFAELNVYRPTGAIFIVLAYPDQAMTRDAV